MLIDRLFEIAFQHQNGAIDEADLRTSVNRYYYFCHLTVRSWAVRFGSVRFEGNAGDHDTAIQALHENALSGIAGRLESLKQLRGEADYDLGSEFDLDDVDWAQDVAEDLYSKLDEQGFVLADFFHEDFDPEHLSS